MNRRFTKITGIFLVLVMLLSMGTVAFAAEEGTRENPVIISNASELDEFAALVNSGESFSGKYIKLGDDIAASAEFTPIGSEENAFSGNFDGNGKTISEVYVETDGSYAGLFAVIKNARIENLTVSGDFAAESYAGAVAAYAENSVITDCKSSAGIYADEYAGGIVGYIDSGKINNCTSLLAVGGYENATGGIAGYSGAVITDCENKAYVTGIKNVGGIAGVSTGDILYCSNPVAVYAEDSNLGGIAGLSEGNIRYCENSGRIIPSSTATGNVGGIAGVQKNAEISQCFNKAAVSAKNNFAGGIAGYISDGSIKDCLVTGTVSNSGSFAGGIFGFAMKSSVSNCVFAGSVTAKDSTFGAIGGVSQAEIKACYYIDTVTKATATGSAEVVAVSEASLTDESVLSALDFTNVWVINKIHASYPLLRSISYHTFVNPEEKKASCTENGYFRGVCSVCKEAVNTTILATGHSNIVVSSKNPTCTTAGYKDELCQVCGFADTTDIAATGHTDSNADKTCDVCNAQINSASDSQNTKTFFQKIADFFNSFIQWLKSIFNA